ncbi:MAG: hypothetical protein ACK6AT_02565, partial [Planctomycetota bacterium]
CVPSRSWIHLDLGQVLGDRLVQLGFFNWPITFGERICTDFSTGLGRYFRKLVHPSGFEPETFGSVVDISQNRNNAKQQAFHWYTLRFDR